MQQQPESRHAGLMSCTGLQLAVILLVILYNVLVPDTIHVNDGYGYDGFYRYKPIIFNFSKMIAHHGIDPFNILRSFPYALIHFSFKLSEMPFSDSNILAACHIYQIVVTLLTLFVWIKLARLLALSDSATLLGFTALFLNFPTLKFSFYYAVMSDQTAVLIGAAALYFYLARRFIPLLLTSIVSLGVWQTAFPFNVLLLLFPADVAVPSGENRNKFVHFGIIAFCTAIMGISSYVFLMHLSHEPSIVPPVEAALPLSILCTGAYLYLTLRCLLDKVDPSPAFIKDSIRRIHISRWLSVALMVALTLVMTRCIASNKFYNPGTVWDILVDTVRAANARPLNFIVGHFSWFGPVVALLALQFKPYCQAAIRLGLGGFACTVAAICLSIDGETRHLCNTYFFVFVPFAMMMDKIPRSKAFVTTIFLASLVFSRFWLNINAWPDMSLYFMNFGQTMSNFAYIAFFCLFGLTLLLLWQWQRDRAN